MQIVINIEKNVKYSTVISTFSERKIVIFPNIFKWYLTTTTKKKKQKSGELLFCKLFTIIKFFFLKLLREAILESKVAPAKHNNSAFLLRPSKTFSNVELFSIFSETFLELIFATKIKTMLLFCLPAVCLNT